MKTIQRLTALLLSVCLVLAALPTAAFAADGTATVTVNVTYNQTEARSMLKLVNDFRTGDDAWAWDEDDTEQVYYTGLSELAYDYALEEAAMQRAAEIALSYSHTRPNGTSCFTAYSWTSCGENIAAGTALNTAEKAFELWQETDESYSGQGHRRNMLSSSVTAVAVACVYYNGCYYWVQEFRTPVGSQTATTANDSATDVDVEIALSDATVTVTASASSLSLTVGETASLPTLTTKLQMSGAWPSKSGPVTAETTWTVDDESCATLSDGVVTAVAAGSTTLTATVLGEMVTVDVTVEEAACEHVTEIQNARDATCTEDGYTGDEVCTICGETVTAGETIPATGHSYESVVTEPTCTEGGYTTYTCSACGDSYTGDGTDATGHSYTYTSNGDGTHTVSCALCDLTAYSESCTYESGVCVSCGASEPESDTNLASGTCGDELTWMLDEDGVLTISGTGEMTDYASASEAPWYSYRTSVTAIVIEDGVTSIGGYAFYDCRYAASVTIADSVTSVGTYAFAYCRTLTSVTIPDSVTSIGSSVFYYCTGLKGVSLGSSVDAISYEAFYYCTSLTSVDIPDSVTSIGSFAFENCTSLTSVTIPDSV
ncbi:MAG: leucine-rich repeat protein, partial [Clostridiales bacterium]|nr:leucine-rich repeat protein [Clostridiales bacterium]